MLNLNRNLFASAVLAFACLGTANAQTADAKGVIRIRSAHTMSETVTDIPELPCK